MIARFFNTSKPIHSVIISGFLFAVFVLTRNEYIISAFSMVAFLTELVKFIIIISSVFVLDFLVTKNKLTRKNGYEILIYTLLIAAFPITMQETNLFISNFFIILALRRIISLRSNLNIKKKLFDATFWICIAALFHFWAILFLLLVLMAIVFYAINDFKNWLTPIISIITVLILIMVYSIIFEGVYTNFFSFIEPMDIDFLLYKEQKTIIPLIIIFLISVWALAFYVITFKNRQKAQRPTFALIFIAFLIGVAIIVFSPPKNGSELLFLFPSLAIILSNYLESIEKPWLAEIFIWILLLTPITSLML